jgi:hypothetical protein
MPCNLATQSRRDPGDRDLIFPGRLGETQGDPVPDAIEDLLIRQEVDQLRAAPLFELGQRNRRLGAVGELHQGLAAGARRAVIKEPFVEVADVLHVQVAIAVPLGDLVAAHLRLSKGEGAEDLVDVLVGQPKRRVLQGRESWKALRREEVAAVGRQREVGMPAAVKDHAEEPKQAGPGVATLLERLGPHARLLLQEVKEPPQAVALVEEDVAVREEVPLFGEEDEHEPHHHVDRGLVDLVRIERRQDEAAAAAVRPVEGEDQRLDRAPHLLAQAVGQLGLRLLAVPFVRRPKRFLERRSQRSIFM